MKQIILYAALIAATFTCRAGDAKSVKLEEVVKPGTKLIYEVTAGSNTYNFIVTVKDLKGSSFDWEMTNDSHLKGTITHTDAALKNATKMYNYFNGGPKTLDDQTLSVWISTEVLAKLEKDETVMMNMHEAGDKPQPMSSPARSAAHVMLDGEEVVFLELDVNAGTGAANQDDFFAVNKSAAFPLIVQMNAGFSIALKEIKTR